jgi:hypothetical protein
MDYKDAATSRSDDVTATLEAAARSGPYSARRRAMLALKSQPCAFSCPRAWWAWFEALDPMYKG